MNPRGNVWNHLYLKVTKTTSQKRDTTRCHITINAYAAGKKYPVAKAAVRKEWKKLETIPAWKLDKVRSKKEVILEAQTDKKKVHFATLMDVCHLTKNKELEPKFQKVQGTSRASRRHCNRRLRSPCNLHRTRHVCVTNDRSKSNGCQSKTVRR